MTGVSGLSPASHFTLPIFCTTSMQGLTLVHFLAQSKHILCDTLGARFPPSLLDRGTQGGVTKTAYVELKKRTSDRPCLHALNHLAEHRVLALAQVVPPRLDIESKV